MMTAPRASSRDHFAQWLRHLRIAWTSRDRAWISGTDSRTGNITSRRIRRAQRSKSTAVVLPPLMTTPTRSPRAGT